MKLTALILMLATLAFTIKHGPTFPPDPWDAKGQPPPACDPCPWK
jgi:hypothetical protein